MKNIQMFCKITNFDLPDLDDFDQYQGFPLKHSNSTSSYLFSARNPSSLLISSEIPIENKQIEINFHQESDLIDFSNSNLEKYEIISFDRIFTCFDSQESLFLNSCKDLVRKLMDGQNSGYLLNGSSWGLKNYTLRGGEGKEKGLILRAYEELINNLKFQEQNYTVSIESWVIYQENIIDLLSEESGEAQISKNKELLLTKVEISSLGELKNAYDSNHFKMNKLSTQMKDPRLKEISHYLFSIVLSEASSKQSTNDKKLTFIRFGSISSSHELKSLQKFINTFPDINKKSHKTLLTYYLSEFNLKNLVILDVLSPNTSPKQLKQCLLNTRVNISNKPEKPPISPTYKDLLKKTPDNANFTKERIREKEGQLDKDFSNLIDRYNHSKSLIDNLGKKKSPIFSTTAKKNNEFMTLEKDILRLKSHIVEKLEATSPPNLNSSQKANLNSNVKKEEFSQAKGSLKKLKGVFEEKEAILVEKCDNLKRVNEDLKENLRLYMEKKDLLEEEVRGKDSLIEEYVGHLQNYEQSLKEERDAMEDLKEKFEEILREKDALSNKNLEIMRKLEKKTKKIQMLKQKVEVNKNEEMKNLEKANCQISNIKKFSEELEASIKSEQEKTKNLIYSLEKSGSELQQKDDRITQLNRHITGLDSEVSLLKERAFEENLKFLDLMKDHETLKHKLEDLKETLRLSEVKLLKSKSKLETEKKQLSDEKNLLLSKKTSKYKKLKEEYTLLQQKQNDHIELNKTFEKEINILKNEKNILEDHLFNIKREFSLLEERNLDQTRNIDLCNKEKSEKEILLQSEINEKAVLKSEIECFKKNLKNLERKVQENEEISQKDYKILTEIRQENSLLIEERANLKEICNKLESQLEFVQTQHNHEIEELDKRTENLIEEMKTLKEENQEMRVRETEMRKNLISSEESMSNLKEKYLKLKFSSRGLKNHLKEVEDKLKDYLNERQMEMMEMEKTKENTQRVNNTKMKMLDEIQSMVKGYRTNSRKLDFSGFK